MLAGRKNQGVTEGTIAFAGQKPTPQFLRRYTGYVEQVRGGREDGTPGSQTGLF